MNLNLIKQLQSIQLFEEDLFPNVTKADVKARRAEGKKREQEEKKRLAEEQRRRDEALVQTFNTFTLDTPVKILVEGEYYDRFSSGDKFKKTLKGSLKAVICKIGWGCSFSELDEWGWLEDIRITVEELDNKAPAGKFVLLALQALERRNGDDDYFWLIKMIAPKEIVLFAGETPDESEEEVEESKVNFRRIS